MGGVFYNAQKAMMRGTYPKDTVHIHTSSHNWLADRGPQCDLLMFIYDLTGYLLYAVFAEPGDTKIYSEALKGYSYMYQLPEAFCIDLSSPFYKNYPDPLANFGRGRLFDFTIANKIEFHSFTTAESKLKIERVDNIAERYLINVLRMRNSSSLEDANKIMSDCVTKINGILRAN